VSYQDIPIEALYESETNPRRTFDEDGLAELATSIREVGILPPLVVRQLNGASRAATAPRYEVVAGARRLRAARLAGLAEIPVVVRDLTDEQALEVTVTENLLREDLPPLEEAEGFRLLHVRHHHGVDRIAEKTGKSREYVYARLKLVELPDKAKAALAEGKISASVALLLARLPAAIALEALPSMGMRLRDDEAPRPYRDAKRIIDEQFVRRLSTAKWDLGDETLLPRAGACSSCRKRTGSDPDLFGDLHADRADVCTDVGCWKQKVEAHGRLALEKAAMAGSQVVDHKGQRKALFPYGDATHVTGGFVDLGSTCWRAGEKKTWRGAIAGRKKIEPSEITVTLDPEGNVRHLVPEKRAIEIARENGMEWASRSRGTDSPSSAADRRRKAAAKLRRDALAEAVPAVVAIAEGEWSDDQWREVARGVFGRALHDAYKAVCVRRGWAVSCDPVEVELLDICQLRGLVVELLIAGQAGGSWSSDYHPLIVDIASTFGVNLIELQARIKPAKAEKKAKAKKKPARKKAARKKGA